MTRNSFSAYIGAQPAVAIGLVIAVILLCVFASRAKKSAGKLIRKQKSVTLLQIFAVALILFMAVADIYAMLNLFKQLELEPRDRWIYAITLAFFLEGQPYFMSAALSDIMDKRKYQNNGVLANWITLLFSTAALVAACALSMYLRLQWIELNGGREAFENQDYGLYNNNNEYIGQIFLLYSPILTSALSFVASWYALRTDSLQVLGAEVRRSFMDYLRLESDFRDAYQSFQEACSTLWSTLADSKSEPMPPTEESFRQECFDRIREKLIQNCLITYPTHMSRYNSQVESVLAGYITEISRHTTLPETITRITVQDIIKLYEARVADDADKWNYNLAGPDMEKELADTLAEAIVIEQFYAVSKPYHLERQGW